jgi:SPP1 family predicted phage head-tail adaptor
MKPYIDTVRYYSEQMMEDSCEVIRMVEGGRDPYGDPLPPTETVVATTICRFRPLGGDEEVIAGRLSATVETVVSLPFGTEVVSSDILRINGVDYNIVAALPRSPDQSPQVDVLAARST